MVVVAVAFAVAVAMAMAMAVAVARVRVGAMVLAMKVAVVPVGRWIIFLDGSFLLSRLLYNFVNKKNCLFYNTVALST